MILLAMIDAIPEAGPDWKWVAITAIGAVSALLLLLLGSYKSAFNSHKKVTEEHGKSIQDIGSRMTAVEIKQGQESKEREYAGRELERVRDRMVDKDLFTQAMGNQNLMLGTINQKIDELKREKVSISSMPAVRTDGPYQRVDPRRDDTEPPPRPRAHSTRNRDGE